MSCCGVCGGQKSEAEVKEPQEAPLFEELPKEGDNQPPVVDGDGQTAGSTASSEA